MDEVEFIPVSPRLWTARKLQWAAVVVPVTVVGTATAWALAGQLVGIAVLVGLAVVSGLWWRGLRGRYRAWGYAEREQDLVVRRGVLFRRLSVVPYGRMQFIDVTAGPVERLFGLATVQLHTAAAASDAKIPGLPRSEAQRLRDTLAAVGEARAMGL
ncbi:MAG: PH domain-containing protein [Pseudonocardiaceae bacterium]